MVLTKEEKYFRARIYKARPEIKEKRREYDKIRLMNPEIKARMKAWRLSDKGKAVAKKSSKKLRQTEAYKIKARLYKRSEKYQKYRRNFLYKQNFGISLNEYNLLLKKQNNVCAICEKKESFILRGRKYSLAIDHCHISGKIRGLLCRNCNLGLGLFSDDINLLKKAITYLENITDEQ